MKISPVHYYYKDLTTQVEMDFTRSEEYGVLTLLLTKH